MTNVKQRRTIGDLSIGEGFSLLASVCFAVAGCQQAETAAESVLQTPKEAEIGHAGAGETPALLLDNDWMLLPFYEPRRKDLQAEKLPVSKTPPEASIESVTQGCTDEARRRKAVEQMCPLLFDDVKSIRRVLERVLRLRLFKTSSPEGREYVQLELYKR